MTICKLLPVSQVKAGDILADDLYDDDLRRLLLRRGTALNERVLQAFENGGTPSVVKVRAKEPVRRGRGSANDHAATIGIDPASALEEATDASPAKGARKVHCCRSCYRELGLMVPRPGARVRSWVCVGCGAVYFGTAPADDTAPHNRYGNLAGINYLLQPSRDLTPPPSLEEFLRLPQEDVPDWREMRAYDRFASNAQVPMAPLDDSFRVVGESVLVQVSDISTGGIGIRLRDDLPAPHLYFMLPRADGTQLRLIASVVRRRRRAHAYELGAQWTFRVADHFGIADSVEAYGT